MSWGGRSLNLYKGNSKVSRKKIYLLAAIAIAVVFVVSLNASRKAGDLHGQQTMERLKLVWPAFSDLPETDRAVLAGFAMSCHLERRPAVAREVVACLRSAADDQDSITPKSMSHAEAVVRLDQLLPLLPGCSVTTPDGAPVERVQERGEGVVHIPKGSVLTGDCFYSPAD